MTLFLILWATFYFLSHNIVGIYGKDDKVTGERKYIAFTHFYN